MKEALNSVSKFVKENNGLNIVLINSPYRFDLIPESCVNLEVTKYNRQVQKLMKSQSKVKIQELKLDRNSFTTHGLHLNIKAKKLVSQDLALLIKHSLHEKQIQYTIPIPWKDFSTNNVEFTSQDKKNKWRKKSPSYHRIWIYRCENKCWTKHPDLHFSPQTSMPSTEKPGFFYGHE